MNLLPTKKLVYGKDARARFASGVNQLANAVATTLGPKGRHVAIEDNSGYFRVTKDGVTVAREIVLEDPFENGGAQIVLEAAQKTAEEAGDGTTTATVLAAEIYNVGMREIDGGTNTNPVLMKRGMDIATKAIVDCIKEKARQVETDQDISNIANISANGDTNISSLVVDAIKKVGRDGHIIVDISQTTTMVKLIEGMRFTGVGLHSMMMINNMEKMQCQFEKARILIWPQSISSFAQLMPIVGRCHQKQEPLIIVCDEITGEALNGLIQNIIAKGVKVAAVRCPGIGDAKTAMLEDLAVAFGAKICSEQTGVKMVNITEDFLGYCEKFTAGQYDYCFVGTKVSEDVIKARLASLESMMKAPETHDHVRGMLRARINKLAGRIAMIAVAAGSVVEANEMRDRVDDALCATRAAIDEGYLPGAGIFLMNTACYIRNTVLPTMTFKNADEKRGFEIVLEACVKPYNRILENAGIDPNEINDKLSEMYKDPAFHTLGIEQEAFGMNLFTGEVCNLVEAGIIDPAKVTRCALQNAVSVAGTMLTCECIICKNVSKQNPQFDMESMMAAMGGPQPPMPPIPPR